MVHIKVNFSSIILENIHLKNCLKFCPFIILLLSALFLVPIAVSGQLSVSSFPINENFDGIGITATTTLPAGFEFGNNTSDFTNVANTTSTTLAGGTSGTGALNSSSTGGVYNYANGVTASSTDRSVGFLTSGSFSSPRDIFFGFTNNTGSTITAITVNFDYEKYRTGTRAWDWTFFHGATSSAILTAATAGDQAYIADVANGVVNPATTNSKTVVLTGLSIANGTSYYFRWHYAGNGGSTNSQGISLDNISISIPSSGPQISVTGTPVSISTVYGTPSSTTSCLVSGSNLTTGILVTAPSGFQISLSANSGFTSSIIVGSSGTIPSTTIYIRLTGNAVFNGSPYSGNLLCSATGAVSVTVAIPSSVVSKLTISTTGVTAANKIFNGNLTATISGASLTGVVNGDVLSINYAGTFADNLPGIAKPVTSTLSLSGTNASSYVLTQPSGLFANILPRSLNITGLTANNKNYNGNSTATLSGIATLNGMLATEAGFPEGLETGSKTTYTTQNVAVGTGSWNFEDALIGTSASDRKYGLASARIQNTGKLSMNFNVFIDSIFVTVSHAKYGTESSSTWGLFKSVNQGSTWTQEGSNVTTSLTTLQKAYFKINYSGDIRFQIRKLSGGILNIDSVALTTDTTTTPVVNATDNDHIAMGNPTGAVTDVSMPTNYLLIKPQFDLAYNSTKGTAAWVAYHLDASDMGSTPRCDCFTLDTQLPSSFYRATDNDYVGTGFDRGHQVTSSHRNNNATNNAATFKMSNIMPQAPNLNQLPWNHLETYCTTLADNGYELFIYTGGYGIGGTGSNGGVTNTISGGDITVPSHYWKVVVILSNGNNDVSRVNTSTRVIAVVMPNTQSLPSNTWGIYRTSVDVIESATGFDFLSNLSASLQSTIEATVDSGPTN